jgi:hypothetical protein
MLTFRLCQRRFALKGFADASPDAAWGVVRNFQDFGHALQRHKQIASGDRAGAEI